MQTETAMLEGSYCGAFWEGMGTGPAAGLLILVRKTLRILN
jgi:hypothetical protein